MELGEVQHSGERIVPGASTARVFGLIGLGVGVLLGLAAALLTVVLLAAALGGPASDRGVGLFATGLFGGGGLSIAAVIGVCGLGLFLYARSRPPSHQSIQIGEHGVAFEIDGTRTELAWVEVDSFLCPPSAAPIYGIKVAMPYRFFTVQGKGATFEARGMPNLEEMGRRVDEAVSAHRFAEAVQKLDSGEAVEFGPITFTAKGIRGFSFGLTEW